MKKMATTSIAAVLIFLTAAVTLYHTEARSEEILRYSCSAQIYEAFGQERLDAFTKETGIKVDLFVSSSGSALYRLMNGFSDIARSGRGNFGY
jgi:phosphate transport system substrate-binding protein